MRFESDFLVLGSGIAGLSFALKAAEHGRVCILTKTKLEEGATRYAQGGIASVFANDDSFESHIQDTVEAGAELNNRKIVEITVKEGPDRVRELIALGVPFTKKDGEYDLTREGGHRARRILHADDFTGQAIEDSLVKAARAHKNIEIHEGYVAIDLITNVWKNKARMAAAAAKLDPARAAAKPESSRSVPETRRCLGTYALDSKNQTVHLFSAPVTVLATGGAGKTYLYTSNPDTATGDGIAIAHRAGARIANMEFMQFHPTCLYHPKAKSFLISEALRGEGGELVDSNSQPFMKKYHPMGSLAPRDIVARAIDSEMKRTGAPCVYLDMSAHDGEFLKKRFPNIYRTCLEYGVDLTKEPIPVVPAAHYTCGGVYADEWGESSIENLYAIGEVACSGLHGANRLASNSLLEGLVFADRALKRILDRESHLRERTSSLPEPLPEWDAGMAVAMEERINIDHTWREIRTLMWNYVGIVRTDRRLAKARARLDIVRHEVQEYYWKYLLTADLIELRNLVTVADLIVECASLRKESRGLHFNLDHPHRDDRFFSKDTVI